MEEKLDSRPFDQYDAADRAEAERRIREREPYDAVVVGEDGKVEVLTASAANATAAQMLQQIAAQIGQEAVLAGLSMVSGGIVGGAIVVVLDTLLGVLSGDVLALGAAMSLSLAATARAVAA